MIGQSSIGWTKLQGIGKFARVAYYVVEGFVRSTMFSPIVNKYIVNCRDLYKFGVINKQTTDGNYEYK